MMDLPMFWFSMTVVATVALLLAFLVNRNHQTALLEVPAIADRNEKEFHAALIQGYRKYKDRVTKLPTRFQETVIIPPSMVKEVTSLPASKASFQEDTGIRLHAKYTGMQVEDRAFVDAIRIQMTRNIGHVCAVMQEEIAYCVNDYIGECKEWTTMTLYRTLLPFIGQVTGRVLVPIELSRNPQWINLLVTYTVSSFSGAQELDHYPKWSHPIVSLFLKKIRDIRKASYLAETLVAPVLEKRRRATSDPSYEMPADMVTWLIQQSNGREWNTRYQSHSQMMLGLASIHTTSTTLTNLLYDLMSHPEAMKTLREEYEAELAASGGEMTKMSLNRLPKMDSALKESQRMHPVNAISIVRLAMMDIPLSTGSILPKGTHFAVASDAVGKDPTIYPNPEIFDPWRFMKLHEAAENESDKGQWQFVTTSPVSMGFGHGVQACPGRFFASSELKLLLGNILMRYDLRYADRESRPQNWHSATRITVDPTVRVEFRSRKS